MLHRKIEDYRALYGALALVVIGLVLSAQSIFYLQDTDYSKEIIRARWVWEIVLNIQILCFAFMWFSHHNRILFSHGRWRARAIMNFTVGFVAVGTPAAIMVISASLDWYRYPPDPDLPKILISNFATVWLVGNFIVLGLKRYVLAGSNSQMLSGKSTNAEIGQGFLFRQWPAVLALVLLAVDRLAGVESGLVVVPFLCFLRGAIAYYLKAFKVPFYETEKRDVG